ncbi:MAG: hypothetical protein WAO58_06260 [Fimbriimonadaceae bacterium]
MRRVHVCGDSGSGKTTLAKALAVRKGLPHTELDSLFHLPNWAERPRDAFRGLVADVAAEDSWVIDGNYSSVRDVVWSRADTVVWLDYPLALVLWRLWTRTWRRWARREVLWNGNRERLWTHFFTKDSLFWWVITSTKRRSRFYESAMGSALYDGIKFIRLRSPRETEAWLDEVTPRDEMGLPPPE